MDNQILRYEWGLSYVTEKKKQHAHMVESMYFVMFILFFISPGIAILMLLFVIIMFFNISKSDLSEKAIADFERYKIDMDGITVENVRNQKSHKYMWNEFASYCPYSVQKPLYGSFFKKYAGDDFMLERIGGSIVKIGAGAADSAMVNHLLSKKLKIKNALNTMNYTSFKMGTQKASSFNPSTMMADKKKFSQPRKFTSGAEEKRFYEEKRRFESNYTKTKESSFRKNVIGAYILLVLFSLFAYMIYSIAKDAKKEDPNAGFKDTAAVSADLAQSKETAKCNKDSDCQYYYFADTGSRNYLPRSASKIMTVSDSKGCIWALINRKYGSAWTKQYAVPEKCVLNPATKNRKGCDVDRKVCVIK